MKLLRDWVYIFKLLIGVGITGYSAYALRIGRIQDPVSGFVLFVVFLCAAAYILLRFCINSIAWWLGEKKKRPGMLLSTTGVVLAVVGPFILWPGGTALGIQDLPATYAYGWLVVIGGLLALVPGLLRIFPKNRFSALLIFLFGLMAFGIPIILVAHMAVADGKSINELFYSSITDGDRWDIHIYIGGMLTMTGGILAAVGGLLELKMLCYAIKETKLPTVPLATRLINRLTFRGRLQPLFPFLGIAILIADVVYNARIGNWNIGPHDTAALMFGIMLLVYNIVPLKYAWEKNFGLVFAGVLFIILTIPLTLIRMVTGDPTGGVNTYSSYLLAPQLSSILNIVGIKTTLIRIGTYPGIRFFSPAESGSASKGWESIGISTECAGIYSMSIFIALFVAFVLVEITKLDIKVLFLLGLGLLTAYTANLFRMTIIVIIGYYHGMGAVLWWTHEFAGLIIFAAWLGLFWYFLVKFLDIEKMLPPKLVCYVCGRIIDEKEIYVCKKCSECFHEQCVARFGECANCGTRLDLR